MVQILNKNKNEIYKVSTAIKFKWFEIETNAIITILQEWLILWIVFKNNSIHIFLNTYIIHKFAYF